MTAPKKRRNSGDRPVVIVDVVNVERVSVAASQRDVLVSAEERLCQSHSCHAACHVVVVC